MDSIHFIEQFQEFTGNADELIKNATRLSESISLGLDASDSTEGEGEGNERLLRHYVSLNVVDKPLRQGREAIYNFRHLLQYLTARRLLKQKFSLAKIAEYAIVVPTQSLIVALLAPPHRSEAELLVAAFKAQDTMPSGRGQPSAASGSGSSSRASANPQGSQRTAGAAGSSGSPGAPASTPTPGNPIFAMADLLREIEELRRRFGREMGEFERVRHALDNLNNAITTSMRHGLRAQEDFMKLVEEIRYGILNTNNRSEKQVDQLEALTARLEHFVHELMNNSESARNELHLRIEIFGERIEHLAGVNHSVCSDLFVQFEAASRQFDEIAKHVDALAHQLHLVTNHLGITPTPSQGATK
jgi:DNA-binding transcriptional MerR regulator